MRFPPRVWFPIAALLSAVNLGAVWFAAAPGEATHATIHAALAVAFALWAARLRGGGSGGLKERLEEVEAFRALEGEVGALREALAESRAQQEFAEQLLARRGEAAPQAGTRRAE